MSLFKCQVCGSGVDIPKHCGSLMKPQPTADSIQYLVCEGCGYEVEPPRHHNEIMTLKP